MYKMSCVGLLEYNWENPRREKQYVLPMFVPGSAEFFNMNKQQIAEHPEVTAFFERMTFLPLEHITAMVPPLTPGIMLATPTIAPNITNLTMSIPSLSQTSF